eukprot:4389653-Pleurochrysis_carterae.AAC.1
MRHFDGMPFLRVTGLNQDSLEARVGAAAQYFIANRCCSHASFARTLTTYAVFFDLSNSMYRGPWGAESAGAQGSVPA